MQAAQYLTATRGLGSPEARICYERSEWHLGEIASCKANMDESARKKLANCSLNRRGQMGASPPSESTAGSGIDASVSTQKFKSLCTSEFIFIFSKIKQFDIPKIKLTLRGPLIFNSCMNYYSQDAEFGFSFSAAPSSARVLSSRSVGR
jgi:hypothetical protein